MPLSKFKLSTYFLLIILFFQACRCGIDETDFHPDAVIFFDDDGGLSQIGPLGEYSGLSSSIYDENNVLLDTSFTKVRILDWNEAWFDEEVKYTRKYKLSLHRVLTSEDVFYNLVINYWGGLNECDSYRINRLQIMIDDSLHYDDDWSHQYLLRLP